MSVGFTPAGIQMMMSAMFTPDAVSIPTAVYFAATFSVPTMNATGDQLDEPPTEPAVGYTRATVAMNSSAWGLSDYGEIYNLVDFVIGTPTVAWGGMYGWALVDAESDEALIVGELTDPLDPAVGQQVVVPAGSLVVGMYG